MPTRPTPSLIDRLAERRVAASWAAAAAEAELADVETLKALRSRARRLRRAVEPALRTAEARLARPRVGTNAIDRPPGADWLWRPEPWRLPIEPRGHAPVSSGTWLPGGVAVFHDCALGEIALRQDRNDRPGDLAPFGLVIDVLGFAGSFLSLAVDLPPEAAEGLETRHVVRAALDLEAERPVALLPRLNLRHGPNTAQISAATLGGRGAAEFDLGPSGVAAERVEKLWLDLIVLSPAMNAVRIRDLTFSRRPRAEL